MKIVAAVGSLSQAAHAYQVARLRGASYLTLVAHETPTMTGVVTEFFDHHGPLKDLFSIKVEIITAKTTFNFWRRFLQPSDLALYCDDRGKASPLFNLCRLLFRKNFALLEDGELAYNWRQIAEFGARRSKLRTVLSSLFHVNHIYGANWSTTRIYVTDAQEFLDKHLPDRLSAIQERVVPLPNLLYLFEELEDSVMSFIRDQMSELDEEIHQALQKDVLSVFFDGGHASLSPWSNLASHGSLVVFPHPTSKTSRQYPKDWVVSDCSIPAELVVFYLLKTRASCRIYVVRSTVKRYLDQFSSGSNVAARLTVCDLVTDDLEKQYFSTLHSFRGKNGLIWETSFTEGNER